MFMNIQEKTLYHQIHPLKLATDIGVTPISLYFVWNHDILPALLVAFVPPVVVSLAMIKWTPDFNKQKDSPMGKYMREYMTPLIELVRFLTLVPMAYGAWAHNIWFILLGLAILVIAWCNGLIWSHRRSD
jgi:hypothetical protein